MSRNVETTLSVFDYLMLHPEGVISGDAADTLDLSPAQFRRAVSGIRAAGIEYGWTVVCEPTGTFGGWSYKLARIYGDAREWVGIRTEDITTRLATLENALAVTIEHTDGRSADGRAARRAHRRIRYLREELADVEA